MSIGKFSFLASFCLTISLGLTGCVHFNLSSLDPSSYNNPEDGFLRFHKDQWGSNLINISTAPIEYEEPNRKAFENYSVTSYSFCHNGNILEIQNEFYRILNNVCFNQGGQMYGDWCARGTIPLFARTFNFDNTCRDPGYTEYKYTLYTPPRNTNLNSQSWLRTAKKLGWDPSVVGNDTDNDTQYVDTSEIRHGKWVSYGSQDDDGKWSGRAEMRRVSSVVGLNFESTDSYGLYAYLISNKQINFPENSFSEIWVDNYKHNIVRTGAYPVQYNNHQYYLVVFISHDFSDDFLNQLRNGQCLYIRGFVDVNPNTKALQVPLSGTYSAIKRAQLISTLQ